MRKRLNVVTYATTATMAAAGLAIGLSLWMGADHAARAANSRRGDVPHATVRRASGGVAVSHCGQVCFFMYSLRSGPSATMNAFIPSNDGTGGKVGRKINMQEAAAGTPDGDFEMSFMARVWQLCGADVHDFFGPQSYLCEHESNYSVFEAEWAPNGDSTGLCAGVAIPDKSGEQVTLRPCGATDRTLWIANRAAGSGRNCRGAGNYCPWMNGSDSNFRAPYVLTMDSSARAPGNQLRLYPENLLRSEGGMAWKNQEFAFFW
jgi:hypothetical protein